MQKQIKALFIAAALLLIPATLPAFAQDKMTDKYKMESKDKMKDDKMAGDQDKMKDDKMAGDKMKEKKAKQDKKHKTGDKMEEKKP